MIRRIWIDITIIFAALALFLVLMVCGWPGDRKRKWFKAKREAAPIGRESEA
jgi:hypothetical protein